MEKLDWPPVWTLAAIGCAWGTGLLLPWRLLGALGPVAGAVLVLAGLGLMAAAALQMTQARTTVIPRRDPAALVTGGVFSLSRNPIYLGDALIVAGACLWLHVPWALPMVGVFGWIIETRFITGEEARLRAGFGPAFADWSARVPRWISLSSLRNWAQSLTRHNSPLK